MIRFTTFLFTRDENDYGYRIRPDFVPDGFIQKSMPMIDLPDMPDFIDYTPEEWKHQYLVIPTDDYICVSRIINTGDLDPVSRPIVAFEGVIAQPGGYRGLLEVLNIIHHMDSEPSIYERWKNGNSDSVIDINENCNPILDYDDVELSDIGVMGDLKKIYEMIHNGVIDTNQPFVVHNNKPRFSEILEFTYGASVFDCDSDYKFVSDDDVKYNKESRYCFESYKTCQIFIRFRENKKEILGYEWIVKDSLTEEMLGKTKWHALEKESNLNEIIQQGENIKFHFQLLGYQVLECGARRVGDLYEFIN